MKNYKLEVKFLKFFEILYLIKKYAYKFKLLKN